MRLALVNLGIAAALLVAAAAANAGSVVRPVTLRADVAEWSIVPSTGSVRAGRVRIEARNLGREAHQLVLARTQAFAERLPLRGDRAVVRPLATISLVRPGGTASFTVSLRPGSYLLLDNLPWHSWKGTSVAFSVR